MDLKRARAWWFERQGLPGRLTGAAPETVLTRTGWSRSVGGANPYLGLHARAGLGRSAMDAAIRANQIHELPSARGCTYVVPKEDYAIALTVGRAQSEAGDVQVAVKHLGVTEAELDRLSQAIVDLVSDAPLDPAEMKKSLGDTVRNLGPEGKKRGITTTLPICLGRLQGQGLIRRIPINGRVDSQRYGYIAWPDGPLVATGPTLEEAFGALAERFFRWIGPATLAHLRWFTGMTASQAKRVAQDLGVVPIESGSEWLIHSDDLEPFLAYAAPREPAYALVGSIDGIAHLRRDAERLVEPDDLLHPLLSANLDRGGHLADLPGHGIFDRGRLVGLWEYDPDTSSIAWAAFRPADAELRSAVARTESFIRDELGDARSFSLDSPASRQAAIAKLRAAP